MVKQIEKQVAIVDIQKELCSKPCDTCKMKSHMCMPYREAKRLAEAGFRRAEDVEMELLRQVKNIFKDIPMWGVIAVYKINEFMDSRRAKNEGNRRSEER